MFNIFLGGQGWCFTHFAEMIIPLGATLIRANLAEWEVSSQTAQIEKKNSNMVPTWPWSKPTNCYMSQPTPKKLHHRRPQTAAQIAHEILETSPEHGHGMQ